MTRGAFAVRSALGCREANRCRHYVPSRGSWAAPAGDLIATISKKKKKITELKQCYIWKLDKKTGMVLQIKREIGTEGEKKRYVQKKDIRFLPQMYIKSISDNLHGLDIKGQLQNVQEKEKKMTFG